MAIPSPVGVVAVPFTDMVAPAEIVAAGETMFTPTAPLPMTLTEPFGAVTVDAELNQTPAPTEGGVPPKTAGPPTSVISPDTAVSDALPTPSEIITPMGSAIVGSTNPWIDIDPAVTDASKTSTPYEKVPLPPPCPRNWANPPATIVAPLLSNIPICSVVFNPTA